MLRYRESPRLKHFDYAGAYAYFVTIVTRQRRRVFVTSEVVKAALDCLDRSAGKYRFEVVAYCFMPDHAHLLVSGTSESSSLHDLMRHFKQVSSFEYKKRCGIELWQTSYHDRVLRREEHLRDAAEYIWHNPVRAGITADSSMYPFSGPRRRLVEAP